MKNNVTLHRLIPVLLLRENALVRARNFSFFQKVGNPVIQAERYWDWDIDELIYLDITPAGKRQNRGSVQNLLSILPKISKKLFAPLTVGGGVSSVEEFRALIRAGADRVSINSAAFRNPKLIEDVAREFGSQAVVISIDVCLTSIGYEVFVNCGKTPTGVKVENWARKATNCGAGELLINSIDRDGQGNGFELPLYATVTEATSLPIIGCGGCGSYQHVKDLIKLPGVNAAAAGNLFNFTELSYPEMKRELREDGLSVR